MTSKYSLNLTKDELETQERSLNLEDLELKHFEYTDHNALDQEDQLDPDNHFLLANPNDCKYYSEKEYNSSIKTDKKFSIVHFNSRSLYANFSSIEEYLQQFHDPFSIIAVSETWIKEEKGVDFELKDYNLNYVNRTNKAGGGVAIYVHRKFKFRILESMTLTINDLLECLTI